TVRPLPWGDPARNIPVVGTALIVDTHEPAPAEQISDGRVRSADRLLYHPLSRRGSEISRSRPRECGGSDHDRELDRQGVADPDDGPGRIGPPPPAPDHPVPREP